MALPEKTEACNQVCNHITGILAGPYIILFSSIVPPMMASNGGERGPFNQAITNSFIASLGGFAYAYISHDESRSFGNTLGEYIIYPFLFASAATLLTYAIVPVKKENKSTLYKQTSLFPLTRSVSVRFALSF